MLPVIDHPALLPLVQDYIQQRKQQQQKAQSETGLESAVATATYLATSQQAPPPVSHEDDEFDDFVSGLSPGAVSGDSFQAAPATVPPVMQIMMGQENMINQVSVGEEGRMAVHPGTSTTELPHPPLTTASSQKTVDKIKRMNLPKVGFSPELSPSTSFDHTCDDEFDDFQSAPVSTMAAACATTTDVPESVHSVFSASFVQDTQQCTSVSSFEPSQVPPTILQPEKPNDPGDKYAVFRELEAPSEESSQQSLSTASADESFGEFCSSEPVSLSTTSAGFPPALPQINPGPGTDNASPVSFEIYSTPPETITEPTTDNYFVADFSGAFTATSTHPVDNYADIHEAMKRAEAEQKKKEASEWSDPFGDFEEAPTATLSENAMSGFSSAVPQFSVSAFLYAVDTLNL